MADKKRCLMLGTGGMAGSYIWRFFPHFKERMEIAAVVDIKDEPLQRAGDFLELPANRRFTSAAEAFAQVDADFCCIVTPPAAHKEGVLLAAERGMDILSEKPIADTWEDCVEIYRAVKRAGVKMEVIQNYRYTSRIMTFKDVLTSGRLGRVNYVLGRFAADYRDPRAWGAWRHRIPHSLLVEGAVHHFDQLRNLADADCLTVAGWEWDPDWGTFEYESTALFVFKMANGMVTQYEGNLMSVGHQNSWHHEYYRAECEGGAVVLNSDDKVRVLEWQGHGIRMEELKPIAPQWQGHEYQINEFLDWLEGGPAPRTAIDDNIKTAAMLFAAMDASAGNTTADVVAKARIEV